MSIDTAISTAQGQQEGGRFYEHRLANGLQLLGQYMPEVQSASTCFYVRTGARDEEPALNGVSHFLEHMTFKGTPTRSYEDINRAFEEMGAENNAGTGHEFTYFYAKVLREYVPGLIDLLADMMRPRLDAADFEQERHVILEEIARYEDMPRAKIGNYLMEHYFAPTGLSRPVLGTTETISAMTVEAMRAYWQRRYGANNMLFAIAGNFDWEAIRAQVEELCGDWTTGETGRVPIDVRPEPKLYVYTRPDLQQQLVDIAFPGVSYSDPDRYAAEVLGTILGDSTGSRLYWQVQEAGLAEGVGGDFMAMDGTGLLYVAASLQPAKTKKALVAIAEVVRQLQHGPISEDELRRAKTKLLSRLVMSGESTNSRMLNLCGSWLSIGKLETLEEEAAQIDAVTLDDLYRLRERVPLDAYQVTVALGPVSEQEVVE
ncbi:MAG TPA: pitrilysin family protein [Chloroflexota bacterium]|jgi:predicted Zn-dependent peptidase|nr:pitrilysin family protein [Chloroflexota bacterium]